ncbi:hypothetical protein BJ741DRAFT_704509 [Chytriomyces cf. hyalinus JEL632]|nr:hypothetical protein BJ741DRAFT_704509 [Chytriomyces cf. hyalinus JEL632]
MFVQDSSQATGHLDSYSVSHDPSKLCEDREQDPFSTPPGISSGLQLPTTSVWVVRPGLGSGRINCTAAVAAECCPQELGNSSTLMHEPSLEQGHFNGMKRESLVTLNPNNNAAIASRIPRSNAISDIHENFGVPNNSRNFTDGDSDSASSASNSEAFQLEEARQHNVASAQGRGTNISDINKRWNEMMKSPTSTANSVAAEKTKSADASIERIRADASAGSSFGAQSKKKTISFSEKVMYRSISHLALEDAKDILDRQINAVVSDIWTDDENEDDTLYSDEGNDWPKKDEFEAIVDGLNIMSLPMDDEDLPPRQTRMPGTSQTVNSAPPVTLNRISFSTSPIHKFIQPQNLMNEVPASPLFTQQKSSSNPSASRDHTGFTSTSSDDPLKSNLTRSSNSKGKSENDSEQKPAASASKFPSPTTANPIYTTDFAHAKRSEMLPAKETGISPILMRSGNSQAPTRSIFNDIDSNDIRWDKCFESGETPAPSSSSPWIKRASLASPEEFATSKPAYSASLTAAVTLNLPLLHEAEPSSVKLEMDEGSLESLAGESQTDQPVPARKLPVKSNLSSDSLNLEEEEIVLESIRPGTGEKVSSAFFIPVDKTKPTEDSGNFKGSKPISYAAPILVNVAPQSLSSQAITPRSTVSDAWIKNPDSADSPRSVLNAASKRKTKKAPPYLKSGDSKSSKEQRLAVEEEFEVPIVVVKMTAHPDKAKLKDNSDDLLQNTNRDSSATLVNVERERVSQKTLKSNFIPLDHERTAKNQLPSNENMHHAESSPSAGVGRSSSVSPYQSANASSEHEPDYIYAQNTAQYRQQFREHYLSIHRDKSKHPYSSPRRSNHPSSYRQYSLNSPSYTAMNYDQPYKSQSALLMNPEIQKRWAAANSTRTLPVDSKIKHAKPFYADNAHLGKTQPSSSAHPKSPTTNATNPTLLRSSTTRLRPFRSFITAPPNSVNSSRATTPLTPSNGSMSSLCGVSMSSTGVLVGTPRKHYRRISFASTTSSLRSVRNRGGGGSGILVDEGGIKSFPAGTRSVSSFESNPGVDGFGDSVADKRIEYSGPVQVEDMNENAEADGVEILEGKRSFPSLPRINSHQEVGVGLGRRKRNQGMIKKWFQDLWCKVVGAFKTRRR